MAYLIDSTIFLRLVTDSDPERQTILEALKLLRASQEAYVLAEFWTVCTRPATSRGGYGLSPLQTERKAKVIERYCRLLPDSLAVHQAWRQLISAQAVMGVEIHDARLVATMKVHQIDHLLTINVRDFNRYQSLISIVTPEQIVTSSQSMQGQPMPPPNDPTDD